MPTTKPDDLAPDQWVTQHGVVRKDGHEDFRNTLRADRDKPERDMSVIRGLLTAEEAGNVRLGTRPRRRPDAARSTRVGTLREAGFRVEHTPRLPRSPDHVSVFWDAGEWDASVGAKFEACFDQSKEGSDG
jgi:hypothetical protein